MSFSTTQRHVAAGMAGALIVSAGAIGAALLSGPSDAPTDRVRLAAAATLAIATCLGVAIADVARRRFFSATDIAGSSVGEASEGVARARAILQNTAEQALLALPVQVALAMTMAAPVATVATLTLSFVTGRALFALGYRKGAAGRAFGFALTFYPTLAALLILAAILSGVMPGA